MSSNTLIEAIFAKDSECSSQATLQVVALLVLVLEHWRPWEIDHITLSDVCLDARFEGCFAIIYGLDVAIDVGCVGCHCD